MFSKEVILSKNIKWFLFLVFVLVLLRSPVFLQPVLDVDESIYGLFARIWFDGGIPYVDCMETKPLGIYFFYGIIFSIFGRFNMAAVHAATIVVVGLTAYVMYLICINLYGDKKVGFWAALFYIVFGTTYIPKYIATSIEPVLLLPVALQYYLWLKFESGALKRYAFLSGVCFSLACLFKYQAGINLIVFILYVAIVTLYRKWRGEQNAFLQLRGFVLFLIGAIPLPLIMLIYLWRVGALDGFVMWNIFGNAQYINEGSSTLKLGHQILARVVPFVASTAVLWVVVCVGFKNLVKDLRSDSTENKWGRLLIVLWLLFDIVPVSAGHRFYGHYFLLIVQPAALIAAWAIVTLWPVKWKRRTIIFWIIFPALVFFIARFFTSEIHTKVGEDNLEGYRPIAEYVAKRTNSQDKIVAWGYAPLVYWYSERLPAVRFFWSDLLTGRVSGAGNFYPAAWSKGKKKTEKEADEHTVPWNMYMDDIARNQPAYIIDTAAASLHDYQDFPISRYPRLVKFIKQNYHEEATIDGAIVFKRNDKWIAQ